MHIHDRIKKACIAFANSALLGQEQILPGGERQILHRLSLEFSTDDGLIVSRMILADKKIFLFPSAMARLLKEQNSSNSVLEILAGRVILREIWWYNKGVESHETTLQHLLSPESAAAFMHGWMQAEEQIQGERN